MDRFYTDTNLVVEKNRGGSSVILVIAIIVVLVILIVAVILIIRRGSSTTASTGPGVSECVNDIDCSGSQICDPDKEICVECIIDANCPAESPICETSLNKCVSCSSGSDCPSTRPICNPANNTCIQCLGTLDCGGANPFCNSVTNLCVGCLAPGDCSISKPICHPGLSTCVECLSNASCVLPSTCVSGLCCDVTAPVISSITSNGDGFVFNGSYTFSQSPLGLTAIFEVEDSTGVSLTTTPAVTGNGIVLISNGPITAIPSYYSGYTYRIKVRLISACGVTPFSAPFSVTMGFPTLLAVIPVFNDVTVVSTTSVTFRLSTPDNTQIFTYDPLVYVSSTPLLDPNRALKSGSAFVQADGVFMEVTINWPTVVSSGQVWYLRVGQVTSINYNVLSAPMMVTIP